MGLNFRLTPFQIGKFQKAIQATKSVGELRRSLVCILVHQGMSAAKCAALLGVSTRTVYRWLGEIMGKGGGWEEREALDLGGHPERWDEEMDSILEAALSHRPDHIGYARTQWTSILLAEHLKRWTGESFSSRTIRRHMHSLGYVWKRPRFSLVPDPQKSLKMRKIREKVANLNPRTALFFLDETDLLLFPPLRSTWSKKGEPSSVTITGWNEKRVVFGAVHVNTGNLVMGVRTKNQAPDFQNFLRQLRAQYRGWHLTILLDEHPAHTARTTELLTTSLEIEFIWLPHRSPELNPLETIWGKAKTALASNRQFEDIDDQADQFTAYLLQIPPDNVKSLCGLTSKDFWLWKK